MTMAEIDAVLWARLRGTESKADEMAQMYERLQRVKAEHAEQQEADQ